MLSNMAFSLAGFLCPKFFWCVCTAFLSLPSVPADSLYLKPNSSLPARPHFSMLPTARMLGWASGCQRLVKGRNHASSPQVCRRASPRASLFSSNRSRWLVVLFLPCCKGDAGERFFLWFWSPSLSLPFLRLSEASCPVLVHFASVVSSRLLELIPPTRKWRCFTYGMSPLRTRGSIRAWRVTLSDSPITLHG